MLAFVDIPPKKHPMTDSLKPKKPGSPSDRDEAVWPLPPGIEAPLSIMQQDMPPSFFEEEEEPPLSQDELNWKEERLLAVAPLPKAPPESSVANFVMALAEFHGVKATRTRLDLFAEAVTRLAGDEIKLDQVGQTLVALAERKLISGDEATRLLHSHILERKRAPNK